MYVNGRFQISLSISYLLSVWMISKSEELRGSVFPSVLSLRNLEMEFWARKWSCFEFRGSEAARICQASDRFPKIPHGIPTWEVRRNSSQGHSGSDKSGLGVLLFFGENLCICRLWWHDQLHPPTPLSQTVLPAGMSSLSLETVLPFHTLGVVQLQFLESSGSFSPYI